MSVGLGCDPVVCESVVTTAVGFAGGDFETKTCPFLFQYGTEVLFLKQKHASFCFEMGKHAQSADTLISDRIQSRGPGWVFTPAAFSDLGSRTAIGLTLLRLRKAGQIRQLARGLYDVPKQDPQLGQLAPSADAIADALKGRDAIRLQPSGAYAANLLGLTEQVPMKLVFLTDGRNRVVKIGRQVIELRRTTPRNMATAGRVSGLVIQALRFLGQSRASDAVVSQLTARLTADDKSQLLQDQAYAPAWMAPIFRRISESATT